VLGKGKTPQAWSSEPRKALLRNRNSWQDWKVWERLILVELGRYWQAWLDRTGLGSAWHACAGSAWIG